MSKQGSWWFAVAAAAVMAVGCDAPDNAYVAPPPPEVTVAKPLQREVQDAWEFTGTTAGLESVEIRPRVSGYLQEIRFGAGELVEPGQVLFTIDPRPFQAAVAEAAATVAAREADLKLADVNVQRMREIVARNAGTELELREREAQYEQAQANLELAKAALIAANLDLEWSQVKAPISGRITRNFVDQGALVDPQALLATIVNDRQVYVYFNASEVELLEYLRMDPTVRTLDDAERNRGRKVYIGVTGEPVTREARMESADPQVDSNTGTIQVRAVYDNPDRFIVPGSFVRVRLPKRTVNAILLPETALAQDQAGRYVLVVGADKKVERRGVTVGPAVGRMRQILQGLGPDEWVVINGLQRARPGIEVNPVEGPIPQDVLASVASAS